MASISDLEMTLRGTFGSYTIQRVKHTTTPLSSLLFFNSPRQYTELQSISCLPLESQTNGHELEAGDEGYRKRFDEEDHLSRAVVRRLRYEKVNC